MKTKMPILVIALLLVAGLILALPVANVQASKVTHFTGWGEGVPPFVIPGGVIKEMGNHIVFDETQIYYNHTWDYPESVGNMFSDGTIVNTVYTHFNVKKDRGLM
jgi:hypothetical protein